MLRRLCFLCLLCGRSLAAQQPVTRADAIAAALSHGARAAVGRADTAAAAATLHAARLYPNPSVAATYTKDTPHYHVIADVPLDLQFVVNRAYDRGPYRRGAVNYAHPCSPVLGETDAAWADEVLQKGQSTGAS